MKKDNEWDNSNTSFFLLKVIESKYAEKFIQQGEIKFNTPKNWRNCDNKARGDFYEGAVASCDCLDVKKVKEFCNKYSAKMYDNELHKGLIIFYSKKSQNLPCFCLYSFFLDDFPVPKSAGNIEKNIKENFSSFSDGKEDQSIIVIENVKEFIERVKSSLMAFGFKENEIMIYRIKYCNYKQYDSSSIKGFIEIPQGDLPVELTYKSDDYANQKEVRVIINSDNKILINKLLNKNLNIGCISDIAKSVIITNQDITFKFNIQVDAIKEN